MSMKFRCGFLVFCITICLCLPALAFAAPPAHEMRGMWVVRTSILSPQSVTKVVVAARLHHFNALFVQVRGRGDAFYQSSLEPRAEELRNAPPGFDPLAEVIRQGHAGGLQVHAWLNTCFVWGAGRRPMAASHVVNTHPDWLARDAHNNFHLGPVAGCEGAFLSPANLAARQHIHDVFLDVVTRYDVDGIHFDYVRYSGATYDFSDAALGRFRHQMQGSARQINITLCEARLSQDRLAYPHAFPREWQEFRRCQVTEMVGEIARDTKAMKPWVVVSAAVFADRKDAYKTRGQDWKTWLERGYLDAVVPMAYGTDTSLVARQVRDAVTCAHTAGRQAYAGLGAWHISAASTMAKIEAARVLETEGSVLFSYGGMTRDGKTTLYLDALAHRSYHNIASVPSMPWLATRPSNLASHLPLPTHSAGG